MYLAILLTMLHVFVTVSPIPLTRDNVTKRSKNDLKVVVSHYLFIIYLFSHRDFYYVNIELIYTRFNTTSRYKTKYKKT